MAKGEISWKRKTAEGERREVYAHRLGNRWVFFERQKRYDNWERLETPPLEDWIELLDGVRRRIARRLLRPEEEGKVLKTMSELFPDEHLK